VLLTLVSLQKYQTPACAAGGSNAWLPAPVATTMHGADETAPIKLHNLESSDIKPTVIS
jgi:hypothetical protein